MFFPPSLPLAIRTRAFQARNGELGISPEDAVAFLDACEADRIAVLGWEFWLVNHDWNATTNEPLAAVGNWCGLIPMRGEKRPAVLSVTADLNATRSEIAKLDFTAWVDQPWRDHIRINFTLAEN